MIADIKGTKSNILVNFRNVLVDQYYNEIVNVFDYISNKYQNIKPIKFENCSDVNEMVYNLCRLMLDIRFDDKVKSYSEIFRFPRQIFIDDIKQYSNCFAISSFDFPYIGTRYINASYFIDNDLKYFNYDIVSKIFDLIKIYNNKNYKTFFMVYYGNGNEGIFVGSNSDEYLFQLNNVNVNVLKEKFPMVFYIIDNEKMKFIPGVTDDLNVAGALSLKINDFNNFMFSRFFLYNKNLALDVPENFAIVDYNQYKENEHVFNIFDKFDICKFINMDEVDFIDENGNFLFFNTSFSDIVKPKNFDLDHILDNAFKSNNKNADLVSIDLFGKVFSTKYINLSSYGYDQYVNKTDGYLQFLPLRREFLYDYLIDKLVIDVLDVLLFDPMTFLIENYFTGGKDVIFNFSADSKKMLFVENKPLSFNKEKDKLYMIGNLKHGILIDSNVLDSVFKKYSKNNIKFFNKFLKFIMGYATKQKANMSINLC